jgi:hypothetical protein
LPLEVLGVGVPRRSWVVSFTPVAVPVPVVGGDVDERDLQRGAGFGANIAVTGQPGRERGLAVN